MSSSEREETLEEFLARMSDMLMASDKPEDSKEARTKQHYKNMLVSSYLQQYFVGRYLGSITGEAEQFNLTFPSWRLKREENYRKTYDFHGKKDSQLLMLADLTSQLIYSDVIKVCRGNKDGYEEEKAQVMPGTDRAREIDRIMNSWEYIGNIVSTAEKMMGENHEISPS